MVVEKKVKSLVVFFTWVMAAAALGFVLLQVFAPSKHPVDKTVYSADAKSTINYNVRMISTPIHHTPKDAEPAKYYIMPFTDYISLDCEYSLNTEIPSNMSVNNYITAVLTSYIEEDNEEVILWEKAYPLSEPETNQVSDTVISGQKTIKLRFEQYNGLIDQLRDVYDYKSNYYIKVIFTTEYSAEYGDTITRETLAPFIRINIDDMLYNIEGSNEQSSILSINETELMADELNLDNVIIGSSLFLVFAAAAILLSTKVLNVGKISEDAKKIRKINAKYGDRIVNVKDKPIISKGTVKVESIEDIVKISDEIGQPIFSVNVDKLVYYYVANINAVYYIVFDHV